MQVPQAITDFMGYSSEMFSEGGEMWVISGPRGVVPFLIVCFRVCGALMFAGSVQTASTLPSLCSPARGLWLNYLMIGVLRLLASYFNTARERDEE